CKRLNFSRAQIFANQANAENLKLFTGYIFRESNVASVVLTYCLNCSRDLLFVNCNDSRNSRKLGPRENLVIYSISRNISKI
ncbi:MAG: hypothetical protein PV344_07455, partial [Anaplasma sp.]|nr:hypothetical protein [Anaplasma sp.]